MLGRIKHLCYTADIYNVGDTHVTGVFHTHIRDVERRQRTFKVLVKDGKFKITTHSGPSGSMSEYFNLSDMVAE